MRTSTLGLAVGAAFGGVVGMAARGQTLVPWPKKIDLVFAPGLGALAGVVAAAKTDLLIGAIRHPKRLSLVLVGVAGVVAVKAVAGRSIARTLLSGLEQNSRALDPGFSIPPTSSFVTGSAASGIALAPMGREGARFVGQVTTPEDVLAVTGEAMLLDPIRVFIGLESAPTIADRVRLAMKELRRTGAFDRKYLLIQSPAGTGYANSSPVDVLEMLSRGDSAAVAIGYGLLPSFLSVGKVSDAAQTQRELLDAVVAELRDRSTRPILLMYGESLGARVQEAAVPNGLDDLDSYGIAHALWVGTPGSRTADEFHVRCASSSVTMDRAEQVPVEFAADRPQVWFLEHDGDPVVRFRGDLIAERPFWLDPHAPRGRNIPETMTWKPGITWAQVLVDVLFATNVKPGQFESIGHDYRADLGAVTTAAFGLAASKEVAERLENRLRELELARAARIAG
ncbi:MAG: alpha/beta-hydrolase family protein [Actinomycetota bacterium]|nr:alpha/beta-hydrolase family protein [Actinomycetota bacterium]